MTRLAVLPVYGAMLGVPVLLVALRIVNRQNAGTPAVDPRAAWLRAGVYFCVCVAVAWIPLQLRLPAAPVASRPVLYGSAAVVLAVVTVAYWVVWPRGTYTLDRPRHAASQVAFGVAWGLCEGALLLAPWQVATAAGTSPWFAAAAAFVIDSTFLGIWHARYWDLRVAPDHNIPEWNARKVLLCHVPNLAVSLGYVALTHHVEVFITAQVVALTGSSLAMRFPRWPFGAVRISTPTTAQL